MTFVDWNQLPEKIQNDAVRPYFDIINRKHGDLFFKRFFDVIVSALLIVLLLPALIFIAAWIKVDSSGPAVFKQTRVTQYGREFTIYKYRTMVIHADKIGGQITEGNDKRITKVGRIIRDSRIDELPQLFNILKGDMTFVGVRPEVPKYVAHYTDEMFATLLLPAGVTSNASIQFKDEQKLLEGETNIDEAYVRKVLPRKMEINLDSILHFSIWNDLKTLLLTMKVVFGK